MAAQVDSQLPQMVLSSYYVIVYICASLARSERSEYNYLHERVLVVLQLEVTRGGGGVWHAL
jgi:hypothetical protein